MQDENQTNQTNQPSETTTATLTKPRPRKRSVDKKSQTISGARPVVYSKNVYHQTIAEYLIRKAYPFKG